MGELKRVYTYPYSINCLSQKQTSYCNSTSSIYWITVQPLQVKVVKCLSVLHKLWPPYHVNIDIINLDLGEDNGRGSIVLGRTIKKHSGAITAINQQIKLHLIDVFILGGSKTPVFTSSRTHARVLLWPSTLSGEHAIYSMVGCCTMLG